MKIEFLVLLLNAGCTIWYIIYWEGPGKFLYWLGATILVIGLSLMRG